MSDFLPPATDFTDLVKNVPQHGRTVECPKCHGYGYWNLKLNAYPGPDRTPEQRYFRAACSQCWSWGFVQPGPDAECIHAFKEIAPDQPFRCWHTIECQKCGVKRSYSSDD